MAKYTILHEMGGGGMGKIYKGLLLGQHGFQRPIVIKRLRYSDDPGHVRLFVEEARRYAVLDHENIGRIFDFEEVGGELCIILEYIDGWSLVEYIERQRELGRPPDVDLAVFIVSRLCRALQYVYERAAIVHRDISPSNIMMTREGTVKLIDFGIATRAGTRDQNLTGKPAYMAPEMVVELRADNRSDLFSLGAVFYEVLLQERLISGEEASDSIKQLITVSFPPLQSYNPDIPRDVIQILERALQRDPERRFASAGEMGEACEHFLYDKGYGPTNLTLKHHLHTLFPEARAVEPGQAADPTLLPAVDHLRPDRSRLPGDATPVVPVERYGSDGVPAVVAPSPSEASPSPRPRRIRVRQR